MVAADTVFQQALALHRQSRLEAARLLYEQTLELEPRHVQALLFASLIALQGEEWQRAVGLTRRTLELDPQNAAACLVQGHALAALKRQEQAAASYARAIALRPELADAHHHLGNALASLQRSEPALASYDRALALGLSNIEVHNNRGNALCALRRYSEAIESYDRAIELGPGSAEIHYNRGLALAECLRYHAALDSYERAVALKPDYTDAHLNRGNILKELRRFPDALASYDRALSIRGDDPRLHSNRGNVLCELRQQDAALESYDRAIALDDGHAEAYCNRGVLLADLGQMQAARASLDHAVALDPNYALAYFNRAFVALSSGDFENGWRDFEWRFKVGDGATFNEKRDFHRPLWLGGESLAGKTILIHREQGFGDLIQFCRYCKPLADLGARVILEAPRSLARLLASLAGVARVVVQGEPLPEFDCHCPLLSLPFALKTTLANIPARVPYVRASDELRVHWREKLGPRDAPRVGLVWAAGFKPDHPHLAKRDIPLLRFAPLRDAGIEFYSVQKGEPAESELRQAQAQLCNGPDLRDFGDQLQDFADTAALIEQLDLVITVDTSTAHLAAALGKPVWILLHTGACWRWLRDRADSPWYPTARLYRQRHAGEWDEVVEHVRRDLQSFKSRAGA
jgi:tetratricopeptide (TPR) repeat protein